MRLLFATTNPGKLEYMKRRLARLPIELDSLIGLDGLPVPKEEGSDPLENARAKALCYYEHLRRPLFSCDSGLYLEGLPEELQPGVHVRRVNGYVLSDEEMTAYYAGLARRFGPIRARYLNAVCLILADGKVISSMDEKLGEEPFLLVDKPHARRQAGFPLDRLSVDIRSGKYYYDLEEGFDEKKDGANAFESFMAEALGL